MKLLEQRAPLGAMLLALSTLLVGCGGSSPQASGGDPVPPPPPPPPPPGQVGGAFETSQKTSRFLTQATFGPTPADVSFLTGTSASQWILTEFDKPPSLSAPLLDEFVTPEELPDDVIDVRRSTTTFAFWRHSISGNDQLRQRMAYALSQILVVSNYGGVLFELPEGIAYHQDLLAQHAFGNYRDLLEAVTYEPAMGHYLTYMGNQKADPVTGRVPDENYARELLQLFTVGLIELNPDGTPKLDPQGQPVELYTNNDITELAKVFTGLDLEGLDRNVFPTIDEIIDQGTGLEENMLRPMAVVEQLHSPEAKQFLNCSIAAGTPAAASITQALDCIMAHPNVGPFIGRQLIQRFTTSNPSPAYVQRVAEAFDFGQYVLPDGTVVGDGRKGDLRATIAAILFDPDVRSESALTDSSFGKIREPVLRFTHWARAFDAPGQNPEYVGLLYDTAPALVLNQHPYRSRSVFNFYRPGYVPPGTDSGSAGMTVPELQIVNATSTTGYINFMTHWAFNAQAAEAENPDVVAELEASGITVDRNVMARAYVADYSDELMLAADAAQLVDHLNELLLFGTMSSETRGEIVAAVNLIALDDPNDTAGLQTRVGHAVLLAMSSPDYLVQR